MEPGEPKTQVNENDSLRKQRIVAYIRKHPFCSTKNIEDDDEVSSSHVTVVRLLGELQEGNQITNSVSRKNAKKRCWVVNDANPVVQVQEELRIIQTHFHELLSFTKAKLDGIMQKQQNKSSLGPSGFHLLLYPVQVFSEISKIYNLLALLHWPHIIQDKNAYQSLYIQVIATLNQMHFGLLKEFEPYLDAGVGHGLEANMVMFAELSTPSDLHYRLIGSKQFGIENVIEPILNDIWNVGSYFHPCVVPHVYPHDMAKGDKIELYKWQDLVEKDSKYNPRSILRKNKEMLKQKKDQIKESIDYNPSR